MLWAKKARRKRYEGAVGAGGTVRSYEAPENADGSPTVLKWETVGTWTGE